MIVLIPAFEPGAALIPLVRDLLAADPDVDVLVVDDGSGPAYAEVFERVRGTGAEVLAHERNRGKGAAIRTGIDHALAEHPGDDVITADADGQHTVRDILRVAAALREDAASDAPVLVLGCRDFAGAVPWRSRTGNLVARGLFRAAAGWRLSDTQTGLRGIPWGLLAWVRDQDGDRFEFEQNVLLRCRGAGVRTREIPIATVYLGRNESSHFRPVVDTVRVGMPLLLFTASSFSAFLIDAVALMVFAALSGWLVGSIVAARILSASVNFAMNRRFVFRARGEGRLGVHILRYGVLALALLASNIVWIEALTGLGVPLIWAKVCTEAVLFVTSYGVQRAFVFRPELVTAAGGGHSRRIGMPDRMVDDPSSPTIGKRP